MEKTFSTFLYDPHGPSLFVREDLVPWRTGYAIVSLLMISVGIFGSSLTMIITYKNYELQTKSGLLLCSHALISLLILLHEIIHSLGMLFGMNFRRMDCAKLLFFYPLTFNVEYALSFSLVLDVFLAITKSTWYYNLNTNKYLSIVWIFALAYGGIFMIAAHLTYPDNNIVPYCDPVTILNPKVGIGVNVINFILSIITFTLFFISVFVLKRIGIQLRETKTIITRIKVTSIVFFVSVNLCSFFAFFFSLGDFEPEFHLLLQTYVGILAIFATGSPFYVSIWKSTEFRRAAVSLLKKVICCLKPPTMVNPKEGSRTLPFR